MTKSMKAFLTIITVILVILAFAYIPYYIGDFSTKILVWECIEAHTTPGHIWGHGFLSIFGLTIILPLIYFIITYGLILPIYNLIGDIEKKYKEVEKEGEI